MSKWIKGDIVIQNSKLEKKDKDTGEEFYISYQDFKDTKEYYKDNPAMSRMFKVTLTPETAIVAGEEYFILKGDFRKEYEDCATLEECMKIYNQHEDDKYF